jgi:MFS family permease
MVFAGLIGSGACAITVIFGVESRLVFFGGMFLLGTVLFPIYSLNVAHANDHAEPHEFVDVSSGLMLTYGIGTICGPIVAGEAMDRVGPGGLFTVIGILFLAYSLYAAWRITRRAMPPERTRSDFQPTIAGNEATPQKAELDPRAGPEPAGDA